MNSIKFPSEMTCFRITLAFYTLTIIASISLLATLEPRFFDFFRGLPLGDKIGHFLIFGGASFVVLTLLPGSRRLKLLGALALACYVVADESLQLLTPNRDFEFLDMFANLGGVATFAAVSMIRMPKRERRAA
ncbi:MAG: VanZ family protein [Anaerolineales bacterium]|nr:VanZ family protein [Anaerolineales bacterium]